MAIVVNKLSDKQKREKEERKKREKEQRRRIGRKFYKRREVAGALASVYPQSAERELKRYLGRYVTGIDDVMKRTAYLMAHGASKNDALRRAKGEIDNIVKQNSSIDEIKRFGRQVVVTEENQFRKNFKRTFGIDMPEFEDTLFNDEGDMWSAETLGFIGAYCMSVKKQLDIAIRLEMEEAKIKVDKVAKEVDGMKDMARNRVGDLAATVNKGIFGMFGIKRYVWRTRRDHKVRDCHKSFDGHIFRVDRPPEIWYMTKHGRVYTGRFCNPGEDYNCRCVAIPLFTREAVETILTREKWKRELGTE